MRAPDAAGAVREARATDEAEAAHGGGARDGTPAAPGAKAVDGELAAHAVEAASEGAVRGAVRAEAAAAAPAVDLRAEEALPRHHRLSRLLNLRRSSDPPHDHVPAVNAEFRSRSTSGRGASSDASSSRFRSAPANRSIPSSSVV